MPASILIVDDEKNLRLMVHTLLTKQGYHAVAVEGAQVALSELAKTQFDLALIDFMMPEINGLGLLGKLQELPDAPPAILMTAFGSVDTVVAAMRAGASDFIAKPFAPEELLHVVRRNIRTQSLEREVAELRAEANAARKAADLAIVAESPEMLRLLATAAQAAASDAPVLLQGETGTGKERIAKLVHSESPRSARPFVAVNCGALHPELLLSELFGHKRGAFTGAVEDRVGRFQAADGGTLFLDEVGELDLAAQVKLLRVLQESEIERVGDNRTIRVDVRIVAATNRRLEDMVAEETFRPDLYYRLAVVPLRLPALRERSQDILPLTRQFLAEFSTEANRPTLGLSLDAQRVLMDYAWPGNIRELRNVIQRAVVLAPPAATDLLPEHLSMSSPAAKRSDDLFQQAVGEGWPFERLEAEYLKALLLRKDLSQADIAEILQIDSSTLWRKRKKYRI